MDDADACFKEGIKHVDLSWHADYHSEVVGDLEAAIGEFDRALALQPDHADAWIQKGIALARLGHHETAAAALAEAIRLRPDDPELWLQKAGSLHELQRHADALAACDEALCRRPEDADALFLRAETLDALGRHAEALSAWDQVLRRGDLRTFNFHSRTFRMMGPDDRRRRAQLARAANLEKLAQVTSSKRGKWTVMGRDTFARGRFCRGRVRDRARGPRCGCKLAKSQSKGPRTKGVRDEYWVVRAGIS
jgi:tetratricopeptide (TPR) repeat protein